MKLVRALLPCAAALAAGGSLPLAVPPAMPATPKPVPVSSMPAPPLPARQPAAPFPGQAHMFVVPRPHGGQILINIPRCYLVYGLQSYAGVVKVTDRAGRPLPLPASPQVSSSAGKPPVPR